MPFSDVPLAPPSSYLRGMGVFGSAAGRSLSFLMLLSTAFNPCVNYGRLFIKVHSPDFELHFILWTFFSFAGVIFDTSVII